MFSLVKTASSKLQKQLPLVLLLLLLSLFLLHPVDLTTSDLGRHLMNGRQILSGNWSILSSNAYSYTMPNQPFINHHWLSGVVFFLVEQAAGITTLHLFHTTIILITFSLLFTMMRRQGSAYSAFMLGIPAVLLIGFRDEIRPETFGYLFLIISLDKYFKISKKIQISGKEIALFFVMQLLWVNLHISFIVGIILPSLLLISSLVFKSPKLSLTNNRRLGILIAGLLIASLANVSGLRGLLEPLAIFQDYGYGIVENKSPLFLSKMIALPEVSVFFMTLVVCWLLFLAQFHRINRFQQLLFVTGAGLGWMALRNLPLFVFLAFPTIAFALTTTIRSLSSKFKIKIPKFTLRVVVLTLYLPIILLVASGKYSPENRLTNLGIGYTSNQFAAVNFFLDKINPTGNIFNNYDIGSYLIYGLYPKHKVFVDNRPEAYTTDFFQEKYIPMQESPEVWQKQMELYDFQVIFFGHRDLTPWGRTFFQEKMIDTAWRVVYYDQYAVIMVRNLEKYSDLISQYHIPLK